MRLLAPSAGNSLRHNTSEAPRLPASSTTVRLIAVAAAAFAATATAAPTAEGEVSSVVFAFAIVILGVVVAGVAWIGSLEVWALLHMGEDIFTAVIRSDKAEALLLKELLDSASGTHGWNDYHTKVIWQLVLTSGLTQKCLE